MLSGERLVRQTTSFNDLGQEFAIPMFFFEGTEDFTTSTALARQYLALIKSPQKEFVPIDGGHFAVFMELGSVVEGTCCACSSAVQNSQP
jgi:hypothetical protein